MVLDLVAVNTLRSGVRAPKASRYRIPEHGGPATRTGPRRVLPLICCGGGMRMPDALTDLHGLGVDCRRRASGVHDLCRLAATLNNRGGRTARGGRWPVSNVGNLVDRLPV
jgi:hypothetical protein